MYICTPMDKNPWECFVMCKKSLERIEAEGEIFSKLERESCDWLLLSNPRKVDIVNQIEKYCIQWYSPGRKSVGDVEYKKFILPRMQMLYNNDYHFRVTDERNVLISLPLLQEDDYGRQETKKEIQYNKIDKGMEKVSILDYRRHGIDRIFKSVRYLYDLNGIEMERYAEKLKRDSEGSKTIYVFKERLKDNPHIIKIIKNFKKTKENGQVSYYDIRKSQHIEDLDEKQGERIEEKDITSLTEDEKQDIVKRKKESVYQKGIRSLMGIGIEQENR